MKKNSKIGNQKQISPKIDDKFFINLDFVEIIKSGKKKVVDDAPPVQACLSIHDLESMAKRNVTKEAWDYLVSGADDEVTMRENAAAFRRVWLVPRILVNVSNLDLSTKVLGRNFRLPLYITACALGKLYHPDGEITLTRGAKASGIAQMGPTLGSCSMKDIAREARKLAGKGAMQPLWWQLYVNKDRDLTKKIVQTAEELGYQGLFITVDAPQLGRRERDMRNKAPTAADVQKGQKDKVDRSQGTARAISSFIDASLNWDDLPWFRSITRMPIFLKGVQCGADAVRAAKCGYVNGIVVSNHGGRQMDYCRSGVECLLEITNALQAEGLEVRVLRVVFVCFAQMSLSQIPKAKGRAAMRHLSGAIRLCLRPNCASRHYSFKC